MADIIVNFICQFQRVAAIFVGMLVAVIVCLPIDASAGVAMKSKSKIDSVEVKGRVFCEDGDLLCGVAVLSKKANRCVLTDFDGEFSIIVPVGAELEIIYPLYFPQTFLIDKSTRNLDVVLVCDKHALDALYVPIPPGLFESTKTPSIVGMSSDSIPTLRGMPNYNRKVKVKGIVYDLEEPLIGAVIRNAAAGTAVLTDNDGKFEIGAIVGSELEVSYIGYDTQYFEVDGSSDALLVRLNDIGIPNVVSSYNDRIAGDVILMAYGPDGKLIHADQLYVCRVLDDIGEKELYHGILNASMDDEKCFSFPWVYLLSNADSDEPEVATLDVHCMGCKTERITLNRPKKKATINVYLKRE